MLSGEVWRLGHRPALDGLRGVAILLVVVSHGVPRLGMAGAMGVTLFFTLSGFLITSILLEELATRGRIDLRAFYVRRARRLAPALLAFLFGIVALAKLTGNPYLIKSDGWAVAALLYVHNWGMAREGANAEGVSHLWSLSIEEQFYIAFPLLLLALARRRTALLAVVVAAAIGSVVLRLALWRWDDNWQRFYFGTDTNAFALLAGVALAVWLHGRSDTMPRPRGVGLLATAGIVVLAVLPFEPWSRPLLPVATAGLAVVGLAWLVRGDTPGLLAHPALRRAGRVSYAWYLWHLPLMHAVWPYVDAPKPVVVATMAVLSYLIAEVSWRVIERPFLVRRTADRVSVAV